MKNSRVVACLFTAFLACVPASAAFAQLSGTFSIGPGGDYPDLTTAAGVLFSAPAVGEVVFELLPAYSSAGETFPISLSMPGGHLTIRPRADASGECTAST